MDHIYQEVIFLVERLHRHFLEVVKSELERLDTSDINNIQALILFKSPSSRLRLAIIATVTNRATW